MLQQWQQEQKFEQCFAAGWERLADTVCSGLPMQETPRSDGRSLKKARSQVQLCRVIGREEANG